MNTERASSSISATHRCSYDVFLSFRGADTRNGFTSHLYQLLDQRSIYTFIDDEKLEKRTSILPTHSLLKAIDKSRIRGEDTHNGFTSHLYQALDQKGICTSIDGEKLEGGKSILPMLLKAIDESRFRGEDTRNGFTSHLYQALDQKGICTSIDGEKLERGKSILPMLLKAIDESRFRGEDTSNGFTSHLYQLLDQRSIYTFIDDEKLEKRTSILPTLFLLKAIDESRFRGEDTSNGFTSHLYQALDQKGICTSIDGEKLERRKSILPLLKAIDESRFAFVILSKNFAHSKWCLDELAEIIGCKSKTRMTVLPIFYNVDSSDVRNQTGTFKQAFDKHKECFKENIEKVQKWGAMLREVANKSGWHLSKR